MVNHLILELIPYTEDTLLNSLSQRIRILKLLIFFQPEADCVLHYTNQILTIQLDHPRALALQDQVVENFELKGKSALREGRFRKAAENFEYVLLVYPDDDFALQKLGEIKFAVCALVSICLARVCGAITTPGRCSGARFRPNCQTDFIAVSCVADTRFQACRTLCGVWQ